MYYKIYPDVIFLVNLLMNYTVLSVSCRLCKTTTTYARLALAAGAGAAWSVFIAVYGNFPGKFPGKFPGNFPGNFPIVPEVFCTYLGVPAVMLCISGKAGKLSELVRRYIVLMATTVLAGGVLLAAASKSTNVMWMAVAAVLFWQAAVPVIRCITGYVKRKNLLYEVWLELDGRSIHAAGLYDTGNSLADPYNGKPVCVAEKKVLKELMPGDEYKDGVKLIPYKSLGKEHGLMRLVTIDSMVIEYDGKRMRYEKPELAVYEGSLSGSGQYEIILNAAYLDRK